MRHLLWLLLILPKIVLGASAGGTYPPYVQGTIPNQTFAVNSSGLINPVTAIKCSPNQDSTVGNPSWSALGLEPTWSINSSTGRITVNTTATPVTKVVTVSCTNSTALTATYAFTISSVLGVQAVGYYVDCLNGNDGNAGTTAGSPWKTINKANAAVTTTGVDLWLLGGTTCSNQVLTLDWNGISEADPAIVGGYYVSGGVAYQNIPTNYTASQRPRNYVYTVPRPIIEGSYKDSCRNSFTNGSNFNNSQKCAFGNAGEGNYNLSNGPAVPSSQYAGLVVIQVNANYHDQVVQDLDVRSSAGHSITVTGPQFWCTGVTTNCNQARTVIRRVRVDAAFGDGIFISSIQQSIMRDSYVTRTNMGAADKQYGQGISGSGVQYAGNCNPCQGLVENLDIANIWGEGTGHYGATFVLTRGIEISNSNRGSLDDGASAFNVFEQNIIQGGSVQDPKCNAAGCSYGGNVASWGFGHENGDQNNPGGGYFTEGLYGGEHLVRRNNIVAAPDATCLSRYTNANGHANTRVSGYDVGNTCIVGTSVAGSDRGIFDYWFYTAASVDQVYSYNNLTIRYTAATECNANLGLANLQGTHTVIDYNQYSASVIGYAANCQHPGTHDIINSNTGLNLSSYNFTLGANNWPSFPNASLFKPASTGAGVNAGVALTASYLTPPASPASLPTAWDAYVLPHRTWLPAGNTTGSQVPASEWKKIRTTDFNGDPLVGLPMGCCNHGP